MIGPHVHMGPIKILILRLKEGLARLEGCITGNTENIQVALEYFVICELLFLDDFSVICVPLAGKSYFELVHSV